ncbi:MAG TPA: response regulator transcription factor [Anaerolineales bacterium]|nr:response regulator transcription factor [Anaerolineales bacterium]
MNKRSILIVEDEPSIAEVVALYLQRAGFQTLHAPDGVSAQALVVQQSPDLGIIDIMLPGLDGLALTRWLRDRSNMPIILLTARRAESDRIAGLELGADDYVVKPFSPQELVSRVRAVLRRAGREQGEPAGTHKLVYEELAIDPPGRLVTRQGRPIPLTAREFDMLLLLASHPRQVFTRDQLLERAWGLSDYIDPGTVTVHVRRLREKIEADPARPAHIITVWGVGYKFEP